jgi:hypothetical protein
MGRRLALTTTEKSMNATHIVTTYYRNGCERSKCVIVEVCKPLTKHDDETHRVQLIGDLIIRVSASQLKPI